MVNRVLFKNTTNRPGKRVRLTHGDGVSVDVGHQTGAVYYEDPEIGMCLSKPMTITPTDEEETQCMSLVGLYDLFIDGERVGRAMTQEEITQRVNAGDYGVEVVPCMTISCEDAVGESVTVNLPGLWDVEINDVRIAENVDEKRILAILKDNKQIRAVSSSDLTCTPSGEYVFKVNDLDPSLQLLPGTVLTCVVVRTIGRIKRYVPTRIMFYTDVVLISTSENDYTVNYRTASEEPWDHSYLLDAIGAMSGTGINVVTNPTDYQFGSSKYCELNQSRNETSLYATNMTAFTQDVYQYTGGYNLDFSNMVPVVYLKVNMRINETTFDETIELTPFTFTPNAKTAEEHELDMLNHFKTQLEGMGVGFECEVRDEIRYNIPPAYNGGPVTSTRELYIKAPRAFMMRPSCQWQGTAHHGEYNNTLNGWEEKAVGIQFSTASSVADTAYSRVEGCFIGPMSSQEVGYTLTLSGQADTGQPLPGGQTFIAEETSFQLKSFQDEGVELGVGEIDLFTLFPGIDPATVIFSCGYLYQPPM